MKSTKKILLLLIVPAVLLLSVTFNSCSDDSDNSPTYVCETCARTPDALPANDASAKGVYKGIVVGSSGSLFINIQNGSNAITATMVLDGISTALISNVTYVEGQAYVAPFTGIYNGSPISITFSVGLGGATPQVISSDIPGHPNAVFTLYKETSTSLIEAYEGTYSKTGETGTFNILLSRGLNLWGGVAKNNAAGSIADEIDGTINGNNQLIVSENGVTIGTLSGDSLNGSFQDGNNQTITVTGQRTL